MAPTYPGYNNYWDPANSQAHNQQGYSYQDRNSGTPHYLEPSTSGPSTSTYQGSYPTDSTYNRGWYGANGSNAPENRAAETLSSLSTQGQDRQYGSSGRSITSYTNDWASATPAYPSTSGASAARSTQRVSSNVAPQFDPQPTSQPPIQSYQQSPQQAQSEPSSSYSYNAYNTSSQYGTSQTQQTSASATPAYPSGTTSSRYQPTSSNQPRSNSPYQQQQRSQRAPSVGSQAQSEQAKQKRGPSLKDSQSAQSAGQGQNLTQSRTLTPSAIQQQARKQAQWRPSNTEAPAPITVDPTQVYDPWPEQQRQAQLVAEQRRKAEEAKRKAEEEVRQAEEQKRKVEFEKARKAAEEMEAEQKRKQEAEQKAAADASERARKTAEQKAKRKQAKEDRKSMDAARNLARTAATQMSEIPATAPAAGQETDMEREMRKLFEKMREYNAKDPKLLAKLWEEERQAHVSRTTPTAQSPATQPAKPVQPVQPVQPAQTVQTSHPLHSAQAVQPFQGVKPQANTSSPLVHATASGRKTARKQHQQSIEQAARPSITPAPTAPASRNVAPAPFTPQPTNAKVTPPPASQQTQHNTAIWPAGKKQQLADAAVKWLLSKDENRGKRVSMDTIVQLLDSNPSYIMLCESLERLGLVVDRGNFAVALLRAVPDLSRTTPAANTTAAQRNLANGANTAAAQATPTGIASQVSPRVEERKTTSLAEMYRSAVSQPDQPAPKQQSPFVPKPSQPEVSRPPSSKNPYLSQPPRNKLEAARKRGFAELIDLTAQGDSDEELPPNKIPNNSQYPGFGFGQDLGTQQDHGNMVNPFNNKTEDLRTDFPTQEKDLQGKILVTPILRENVARKSKYDPRTIARDVLLATGRHPEMRALNSHLMGIQGLLHQHSGEVELNKFDLASIRWDIIDPGDPIVEEEDQKADVDDMDADDEDEMPAPAQIRATQRVDHGDGTVSLVETREPAAAKFIHYKLGKRKPGRPRRSAPGQVTQAAGFGETPIRQAPTTNPQSEPGRRPAPPNGRSDRANQQQTGTPAGAQSGQQSRSTEGTPGAPSGYAAFRSSQLVEKKKGRPVGWRKAIHSKAAQAGSSGAEITSQARASRSDVVSYDQVKRRAKRPKEEAEQPVDLEPHFNVYECKWEDCSAELHNIDTLRKHVVKIHGKQSGRFACLWGDCQTEQTAKGKQPQQRAHFDGIMPWTNHMERSHIHPIARRLGDGPRGGLSDHYDSEQSEAYLSDATGRIITPRATPMDTLEENERMRGELLAPVLRRGVVRGQSGMKSAQEDDELSLQSFEARKLILGPGLERGGVRLATEQRRRGLLDDEEFEGNFSADDGPEE